LKFEYGDLLGLAVFEDGEIRGFEVIDWAAGFVLHRDIDDDQVAICCEGWLGLRLLCSGGEHQ